MAIEQLPDTVFFRNLRIPLADFIEFPDEKALSREGKRIPSHHPNVYFRSRDGLYLCSEFFNRFSPHLLSRPAKPSESHLFVWILKKTCRWGAALHNFPGAKQPVPWWVIRPFLKYAQNGDQSAFLASRYHTPFFMGAKGYDDVGFTETVSLKLSFGALHTEWWIGLYAPEKDVVCHEGQTFLSVL